MNHPLAERYFYKLYLETTCYFLGHRWKYSPRVTTEWYDNDQEAPYGLRKSSGNAMWTNVAWWRVKCTRCREKRPERAGEPHNPWYKRVYRAVNSFFGPLGVVWDLQRSWESRHEHPWWVNILAVPMSLNSGFVQAVADFWASEGNLPWSWISWSFNIQGWWYDLRDRHRVEQAEK